MIGKEAGYVMSVRYQRDCNRMLKAKTKGLGSLWVLAGVLAVTVGVPGNATAQGVKKSASGICHCPGGQFYDRTTNFTEFETIDACLDSGGREPQRGQGDCSTATADDSSDTDIRTTDDAPVGVVKKSPSGSAQEGTSQQLMSATHLQCEFNVVVAGRWDENGKILTEVTTQELNLLFTNIQDESATIQGNQGESDVGVLKRAGTLNMIEITSTMVHITTVFDTIVNGRFLAVYSRHSHLLRGQVLFDAPAVIPSQHYGHCTSR